MARLSTPTLLHQLGGRQGAKFSPAGQGVFQFPKSEHGAMDHLFGPRIFNIINSERDKTDDRTVLVECVRFHHWQDAIQSFGGTWLTVQFGL